MEHSKLSEVNNADPQETQSQEVRRSGRQRYQTEKMDFQREETTKKEREFINVYSRFKDDVSFVRIKLKSECSMQQLENFTQILEENRRTVEQAYEGVRKLTTPLPDIRRKMDTCTSVTSEVISLLEERYSEEVFDPAGVKKSLSNLLQRKDARSVYGSTVSRLSRSSGQSSQISLRKAEAAARLASKQVEIQRNQEISKLKETLRELENQRDLEIIAAEYNAYAEADGSNILEKSEGEDALQVDESILSKTRSKTLQTAYGQITPKIEREDALVKVLRESLLISKLPTPEPSVFKGDPLEFVEWSTTFKSLIEESCKSSAHKLFYLKKYVGGETLSALQGMFYRTDEEAYTQAWDILQKRYGHPFVIQRAFREKLKGWPRIGPRESFKLRDFSDFLITCSSAMPHISGLQVLNDCEENQKLLRKLPGWVTDRWNRYVTKALDKNMPYPSFKEFSDFVSEEARIACNPISSLHALNQTERSSERTQTRLHASALATSTISPKGRNPKIKEGQDKPKLNGPEIATSQPMRCHFCGHAHFIYKCEEFRALSLDQRRSFILTKNMCLSCLRVGHFAKDCKKKVTCNICRLAHPTPLHEDKPRSKEVEITRENSGATSLYCKKASNSNHTSMIIPVWLSCTDPASPEVLVYALLDTQSSNTFINRDVCEIIKADSEPVRLKLSTIASQNTIENCQRISGLKVRGYFSQKKIELPPTYTREYIPLERNSIPTCKTAEAWKHLVNIAKEMPEELDCPIGLLIGYDCAAALKPRKVIAGRDNDPFAVRTDLGWCIVGPTSHLSGPGNPVGYCHRTFSKEIPPIRPTSLIRALEMDFCNINSKERTVSQEDIKFLEILSKEIQHNNEGHIEMPLPFRARPHLPKNKHLAEVRLKHLKTKFKKYPQFESDYIKFMEKIVEAGDAEEVYDASNDGSTWYIPHHGVYHPRKPGKIRVVFDCSAKFKNTSLNDHLLTGPDLINALPGVLCRFREHRIALTCDVESMFHRFHVNPGDRDFLRFLWWKDGDTRTEPREYRMRVHIFGASSSPGCANYGFKHLANKYQEKYPLAAAFIQRNFYVDDGLISVETEEEARQLIREANEICAKGQLHLHKFVSNKKGLLDAILEGRPDTTTKEVDLNYNIVPTQSVLGVKWNTVMDTFAFNVTLNPGAATRRGILSTVASVYDPLGFIAPFLLAGKRVLQEMCKQGVGWDEPLPSELKPRWESWIKDVDNLKLVQIQRCFIPDNIGSIEKMELHHFSDASTTGYGQCTYLRIVSTKKVHCTLVMGKARVAPIKVVTVPRLELVAATVSATISNFLKEELDIKVDKEYFWTDSQVVLGYIKNDARRFHVFVANRVQKIRDSTDPNQWSYVDTKQNPADHASRGLTVGELINSNWFTGPEFLWDRELITIKQCPEPIIGDPEVRVLKTMLTETKNFLDRFSRLTNWNRLLNVVARIKRLANKSLSGCISVRERELASFALISIAQREAWEEEFGVLNKNPNQLTKNSGLYPLDPIMKDGLLRVGGRLKESTSTEPRHPIILPKESLVTRLIIDFCHKKTQHQGRGMTLNEIRANGYWIIGVSKKVERYVKNCVICRRMRRPLEGQRMADLPVERVEPHPPFSYIGMDCFGPFYTKHGRKDIKRYGLLFTCLSSRAIHLEMLEDLSTDAFLNALRCFIALRGAVRQIRCDQGTNFVGGKCQLEKGIAELDHDRVARFLAEKQCDFKMNVPGASHMGGVWERQIRTVKGVMSTVLASATGRLDDFTLRTFLYEAMAIVNSRPLTVDTINDPKSLEPLTPNHLIQMKTTKPLPPPGNFLKEDLYARKRWRRVQYLVEQFWNRWRKEYLANISTRQRWHAIRRNIKIGDIVLIKEDNLPRNEWKMAKVVEAAKDKDGLVRKVKLQLGQDGSKRNAESCIDRPIHKLVVLVENNDA